MFYILSSCFIGLKDYGLAISDSDLDKVVQYFDRDGSGSINFDEFLVGIVGHMNARREDLVRMAFRCLDHCGKGYVTLEELARLYDTSSHPEVIAGRMTPEDAIREFSSVWDRNGDSTITVEEFIEYYNELSAGIKDDDFFELMIRNAWRIAGGVGWSENTSNRRVLVVRSDGSEEIVMIENELGLDFRDINQVRERLEAQGVQDIVNIKMS